MIWWLLACRLVSSPEQSPCAMSAVRDVRRAQTTLDGVDLTLIADAEPRAAEVATLVLHGGFEGEQSPPDQSAVLSYGASLVQIHSDLPGADSHSLEMDHYGPDSQARVARLLEYAQGDTPDDAGCTLKERADLASGLMVVGLSNGGNLALASLADPQVPAVDALLLWETPSSAQVAVQELHDPERGACSLEPALRCEMDYSQLEWSDQTAFLDRNNDGRPDLDEPSWKGFWTSIGRTFSPSFRAMLEPSNSLASLADTEQFWGEREGAAQVGVLALSQPDLHTLMVAGERDHLQELADSPHVMGVLIALDQAGLWTRLNPDAAYLRGAPDLDAGGPYVFDDPQGLFPGSSGLPEIEAAAEELADRVRSGDWTDNLQAPL